MDLQIPTPAEIEQKLHRQAEAKVAEVVPQIVEALEERYQGHEVYTGTFGLEGKALARVQSLFAEKGWQVEYKSDRDGDALVFSEAL